MAAKNIPCGTVIADIDEIEKTIDDGSGFTVDKTGAYSLLGKLIQKQYGQAN